MCVKVILSILIMLFSNVCIAQTQKGYVKTKGRLMQDGKIQAGNRISGVSIFPKGRNVVLSDNKGRFTFIVPDDVFYFHNIQKNGYVLIDPEILNKAYHYSKNDIVIVMENLDDKIEEQMLIANKVRSTLLKQMQEKEDEIRRLREQNKISSDEYIRLSQQLMVEQSDNEKLISEMVEAYSKIDYDQLDDFNRKVNECILNGDLIKADSLLRTKGDVKSRISQIRKIQKYNQEENENLSRRQKALDRNRYYERKQIEDVSQDCYNFYLSYRIQKQLDSAAYYLETRTMLDTLNFKNVWECGKYFFQSNKMDKALKYFKIASNNPNITPAEQGVILNDLATCYFYLNQSSLAAETIRQSLDLRLKLMDVDSIEHRGPLALTATNFATINDFLQYQYASKDEVKKNFQLAMDLYLELSKECPLFAVAVASVEVEYSFLLLHEQKFDEALEYLIKGYETRRDFAERYPDHFYTDGRVSMADIEKLIRQTSDKSFVITQEILMLLEPLAENNLENLATTAYSLTRVAAMMGDKEKCTRFMDAASQEFEYLLKENSNKYLMQFADKYIEFGYFYLQRLNDVQKAREITDRLITVLDHYTTDAYTFDKALFENAAWVLKGKIENFDNNLNEAKNCFENSVNAFDQIDYSNFNSVISLSASYSYLADAYALSQDSENAILNYKKRVQVLENVKNPNKVIIKNRIASRFVLGRYYLDIKMIEDAISILTAANQDLESQNGIFNEIENILFYYQYGRAFFLNDDFGQAKEAWEKAISYYDEKKIADPGIMKVVEQMKEKISIL